MRSSFLQCERRFLDRRNFSSPMSGVFQTLFHRACSAGLYFPLEEIFLNEIRKSIKQSEQPHPISFFAAGLLAGAAGGVLLNPLSSIKVNSTMSVSLNLIADEMNLLDKVPILGRRKQGVVFENQQANVSTRWIATVFCGNKGNSF